MRILFAVGCLLCHARGWGKPAIAWSVDVSGEKDGSRGTGVQVTGLLWKAEVCGVG